MIHLNGVHFSYEGREVLSGIDLDIAPGEFVALIGPNGAGKSTFSKLLNGLNKPTQGTVTVAGLDTKKARTSALARKVGFLFQNPDRQLCRSTVRDELLFGLELCLTDKADIQARLDKTLADFHLDPALNPLTASRGERQRVALASLMALTPQLLILDEPTTGLDWRECMHTMELVTALNRQGATVFMVSHDMEVVRDFAQRVLVLNKGRLTADGTPHEVLRRTELLSDAALLPPQIMQLSLSLGADYDDIDTCEEMTEFLIRRRLEK